MHRGRATSTCTQTFYGGLKMSTCVPEIRYASGPLRHASLSVRQSSKLRKKIGESGLNGCGQKTSRKWRKYGRTPQNL